MQIKKALIYAEGIPYNNVGMIGIGLSNRIYKMPAFEKSYKYSFRLKKLIKDFLPPIALRLAEKFISKKTFLQTPQWCTIQNGYFKGINLYVNKEMPAFHEMIDGTYDDILWNYLKDQTLRDATILDVGAHIGYHSLGFSRLAGKQGQVIVFEPNPANLERMEKNISANEDLSHAISIVPVALSDEDKEVVFNFSTNVDDETSSGGYIENSYKPLAESVYEKAGFIQQRVSTNKLDTIVNKNNYQNIRLIKIDVEGAEHLVLSGAVETIKKHSPLLFIEVHSVTAMLHVSEILFTLNYNVKILKEDMISRCFIVCTLKNAE